LFASNQCGRLRTQYQQLQTITGDDKGSQTRLTRLAAVMHPTKKSFIAIIKKVYEVFDQDVTGVTAFFRTSSKRPP
jgi:hypothetical protein